ncbi:MAG: hypothetical protein K0R94_1360, partial [Burkholderiales bacterium]|nr:hypothetical protein [Burkholderiales bacterium]
MIKSNTIKKIKTVGFSAIELIGVLVVFAFIILSVNKIKDNIYKAKDYNQLADQANLLGNLTTKYIEDNYREIVKDVALSGSLVYPVSRISAYIPQGFFKNNNYYNKRNQIPCIYITKGLNNDLNVYLIFSNLANPSTGLTGLGIATIAKAIGNHAGTLVNNGDHYNFMGGIEGELVIPTSIVSQCQFGSPLANNLLMLDLSKNSVLFASMKGNIDQHLSSYTSDPSLKKAESTATD